MTNVYALTRFNGFEAAQSDAPKVKRRFNTRMFSVFGVFIVLVTMASSETEEDLQNNNGWKPLTSEQVLNLHRKLIVAPHTVHPVLHCSAFLPVEANLRQNKQNVDVKPQDINAELMSNVDYIGSDKQNQVSLTDKEHNFITKYSLSIDSKLDKPIGATRRQAKNIIENHETTNIERNILHNDKNYDDVIDTNVPAKIIHEITNMNEKSNAYQVTEVSDSPEIKDLLDIDNSETNENKPYFEPNVKTTTERNLSNMLLNILGNYNIRTNDELTNYALSRNKPKQKYGFLVPIQNKPIRNSENYRPLDPLLAVFLSNYGFYLPGYYGFPGKYHNIYGYLASNNIHNNKPFGAYKIYSDTDSSH